VLNVDIGKTSCNAFQSVAELSRNMKSLSLTSVALFRFEPYSVHPVIAELTRSL